ncbi:MAG: hypothetical protein V4628_04870 [Pseudomonadota bacterium]
MSAPKPTSPTRENNNLEDVTAMFKDGESQQNLKDYLSREMVPVPDFTPPSAREDNICPAPPYCDEENSNAFRSAGVLLRALAAEARAWSQKLPPEYRPGIVAVLHGGLQIQVRTLAQVSFDGIRIEGIMGDSPCSLLAHQDTIQLICHAIHNTATEEDEPKHNPIGFIWSDHDEEI